MLSVLLAQPAPPEVPSLHRLHCPAKETEAGAAGQQATKVLTRTQDSRQPTQHRRRSRDSSLKILTPLGCLSPPRLASVRPPGCTMKEGIPAGSLAPGACPHPLPVSRGAGHRRGGSGPRQTPSPLAWLPSASRTIGGAVDAGPLWPASGQGGRLHGGALSSISAIGGGARGETEGAGPRERQSCPAKPSRARRRPGGRPDKRGQRAWLQRPAERNDQQGGESPWRGGGISQRGWGWVESWASPDGPGPTVHRSQSRG